MTDAEQAALSRFAVRSFRDTADRDYVAARTLHRVRLYQQFLWYALQTLEKYLKAILLFNGLPARGFGHDVLRLYDAVSRIPGMLSDVPTDVRPFIDYLDALGDDRYFSVPHYTEGSELLRLDHAVWHNRRYCEFMGGKTRDGRDWRPLMLQSAQSPRTLQAPHRFRISGGFLEKILKKPSAARENLIWKNLYFGTVKKHKIVNYRAAMTFGNPSHFIDTADYRTFAKYVDFPRHVRDHFASLGVGP